jgi:hypothetical protein
MADESITEAIDRLGGSVTAAEVAMDTGVSVDQCEDELRALMVRTCSAVCLASRVIRVTALCALFHRSNAVAILK